jgi:Phosphotransferase enzyme family
MADQTKLETRPYLLIVTRKNGGEVLLYLGPPSLPSLDVTLHGRRAEQLVTGLHQHYSLETCCLWVSHRPATHGVAPPEKYAVMEILEQNTPPPAGMLWASTREAMSRTGGIARAAVEAFIQDLDRYRAGPETAPFARPAWIQELLSWARAQLQPFGLRPTGGFWQLNAGPTFSLIRLQTNRAPVWFKATGEPNAHELPVSVRLERLLPEYVPRILSVHSSWNGWLSAHVRGALLREVEDRLAWEAAAGALARLQIQSIEKSTEIRASEVTELGTGKLADLIGPFIDRMSELMQAQEKASPAPLTKVELASLRDQLGQACQRLKDLGTPESIGRLDLNPGNIVVSRDRVVFLDWAETYWGHPFFSFAYFLEHFRRQARDVTFEAALQSSYAEPWRAVCAAEKISEALVIAPLVAAFAYTAATRSWEQQTLQYPRVAGHLRSMTRRMHREAKAIEQWRQACLS